MHPGERFINSLFEEHQVEWDEETSGSENVSAWNAEESDEAIENY